MCTSGDPADLEVTDKIAADVLESLVEAGKYFFNLILVEISLVTMTVVVGVNIIGS